MSLHTSKLNLSWEQTKQYVRDQLADRSCMGNCKKDGTNVLPTMNITKIYVKEGKLTASLCCPICNVTARSTLCLIELTPEEIVSSSLMQ